MPRRLMMAVLTTLLVTSLSGCHGSSTQKSPGTPAGQATSKPSASCTIPQNNGGDHDADNNGGPDDGDGCDV